MMVLPVQKFLLNEVREISTKVIFNNRDRILVVMIRECRFFIEINVKHLTLVAKGSHTSVMGLLLVFDKHTGVTYIIQVSN